MTREDAARRVLEECFWGDYRFDVPSLLAHIDEESDFFDRFLIDRIVRNAQQPSQLLTVLYTPRVSQRVLTHLSGGRGGFLDHHEKRRALVRANFTGDYEDPAVRRWVW
jgi:hypothetical protein